MSGLKSVRYRYRDCPRCVVGPDHSGASLFLAVPALDARFRRCREKAVDLMRFRHRLRAAITIERRPDAREGEQWPVLVWSEPSMHHRIMIISRPSAVLPKTGAGQSGNTPGIGARLPT